MGKPTKRKQTKDTTDTSRLHGKRKRNSAINWMGKYRRQRSESVKENKASQCPCLLPVHFWTCRTVDTDVQTKLTLK